MHYLIKLVRKTFRFVRKVYDYRKILWQDRDHDYFYILEMLKYKIQRTRKSVEQVPFEGVGEVVATMLRIEALIESHSNTENWQEEEAYNLINQKWGALDFLSNGTISRPGIMNEEDRLAAEAELCEYFDKLSIRTEAEWDELFTLLKNHLREFWS